MEKPTQITLAQLQLAFGPLLGWEVFCNRISIEEAQRQVKQIAEDRRNLRR